MSVTLTVHRATDQIGGNCIELVAKGERVLLDVGRPLDAPSDAVGLLPATLELTAPVAGVLVSHPHQDHYGLLEETPAEWPVYCGAATEKLIRLTAGIFGKAVEREFRPWSTGRPLTVGEFRITPLLTDHSAFDAHMLLIEYAGKRLLYSGDFRRHGRKGKLVERLMSAPPPDLDVLLLEGTNLGSDKPTRSESDLEEDFVELFRETPGRVFVAWSAQNLDRTVTLYRSCLRAGRSLVIDLYTAEVLLALAEFGKLPQPDWSAMKVVITRSLSRMYRRRGRGEFVDRMARNGISAKRLGSGGNWVVMIRPSLARDFEAAGVTPTVSDAWSWSMWSGYLRAPDGETLKAWFDAGGSKARHIHTSGHASQADLEEFANALDPKKLVPIHGVAWDAERAGFRNIHRLRDGEPLVI